MKKILILTATLIASFCMSINVFGALSVPSTLDYNRFNLQWSDEFDGTELNRNNWTPEIGNGFQGWGNWELEYYMDSENNIQVSDGTLKLIARAESVEGYDYTSARLQSSGKVECGYGYVEARIKLPSVNGIWPAFWMLGAGEPRGWPYCGEIDILEAWNTGDFVQNCLHYADDNSPYYETEGWRSDNYSNVYKVFNIGKTNWHTYGVYKTKDKLVFYYDGKIASRVIDITDPVMSEAHNNYYLLLNVACGGTLASNIAPNASDLPAQMEVDYVRYYVEKPADELASIEAASKEAAEKASEEASRIAAEKEAAEKKAAEEAAKKAKPKRAYIKSLKNLKGRKMYVRIKKIKGVTGYQIRFCDNKKFWGYENRTSKKYKVTIKRLEKKTTYWVKVRAYKIVDGKRKYGAWSKVKKVKIRK